MWFLVRTAFWIGLVLVFLPVDWGMLKGGAEPPPPPTTEAQDLYTSESAADITVSPWQALDAAQTALSDLSGFCSRNASACETGATALSAVAIKARDGARFIVEFLDRQIGDDGGAHETHVSPRDEASPERATNDVPSGGPALTNTLTAADRLPPWRMPSLAEMSGEVTPSRSPVPGDGAPASSFPPLPAPKPVSVDR